MRKHGGVLVHCSRDDQGLLEIIDTDGVRTLHFGTTPKQSAMSLEDPDRLELPYVRAMLAGLLFTAEPRRVLLLGLGGGSLAKFLLRHFPDCRIDAVEARASVEVVARRFFGLPEDERLKIHIADGNEFVCSTPDSRLESYDHILVDVFDQHGISASIQRHDFFACASRLLNAEGVFAINLWGSQPESLRQTIRLLKLYFAGGTLRLQVIGRGNVIGFGLGAEIRAVTKEKLRQRARILEQQLGIEFPRLLHVLSAPGPR
jgi:spermidine synthase